MPSGAHEPTKSNCADALLGRKNDEQERDERAAGYQVDEHGVGSHLEPSGSFLKCGLTM